MRVCVCVSVYVCVFGCVRVSHTQTRTDMHPPPHTPPALSKHKAPLTTKYLEPPKRLSAEFGQWWSEIQHDERRWSRYEETAEALDLVTKADLMHFFEANVLDQSSRRQISVHIHCAKHPIPVRSAEPSSNTYIIHYTPLQSAPHHSNPFVRLFVCSSAHLLTH